MSSTFAHPSVSKHEDDIVLANFLTNKLILDQSQEFWHLQQPYNNYYYHSPPLQKPQSRQRISSSEQQVHKITTNSTRSRKTQIAGRAPINSNNCNNSATKMKTTHMMPNNKAESKRRSKPVLSNSSSISDMENIPSRGPPSVSSVASSSRVSIQSEMSINTKISLSKKLFKVFSMGSRSSKDLTPFQHNNDSLSSIASQTPSLSSVSTASSKKDRSTSFRRRSLASISNLFNKSTPSIPDTAPKQTKSENERRYSSGDLRQLAINKNKKKPDLQVDTKRKHDQKNGNFRYSNTGGAPDSPNSVISSRSSNNSRLPQQRFMHPTIDSLPSPTPSPSSSSSTRRHRPVFNNEDDTSHYGFRIHGSPRLRPAANSSTSSLVNEPRKAQFCSTVMVHETFSATDYDRRCDPNTTCQKLTVPMAMKIKQELNEYKLTEMEVHVDSRQYTQFFL
ncbi:hypothetical protein K501DRAFT_329049 [Backusella circina FSU 941]|nr:hypothetical protein K501DRAFT_329049 [Backusella circina FSU 941]